MPIYEYRCSRCGAVFARLQSLSSEVRPMPCPSCHGEETERLLSTFAAGASSPRSGSCGSGASGPPACGGGGG
ncbi:MAG: zinc ribbon domain-containing protein [Thermoanaerobaculales bacterium]|jgi:putative FmdB family regulatory protein|nr:zinc ribbon domain-containing protein [Thermoanaerobaculales bacterium]